jgi:hypothetical protein
MSQRGSGPKPAVNGVPALAQPAARGAQVAIERMSLKLPGTDAIAARRIVRRAGELAAERIPSGLSGRFPRLSLRVRPHNLSEGAISEAIAAALVGALGRGGRDA